MKKTSKASGLAKVREQSAPVRELIKAATAARKRSYSPYSKHKVGAAIRLKNGEIFTGCNIENSSYGGTVCAERTAIFKAVSENGKIKVAEVAVVTDSAYPWPPCGFCRQVIAEFASPEIPLYAANLQGDVRVQRFGDIMPDAFTPDFLGK
ncbi:MAG: cytidine deaminase [Bdellovibrionia bacterium]